ncbi:MAG: tetratricopeptide repeat protein [Gammaproteobacteria bacterium]|nr:tetratricopeptide repeat protein [Gammaproteobacteria bacterium]
MASYANDEEQVEALKRWWQENGTSLLTGIVIVLVVLFGSRQWQGAQLAKAEAASDLYEDVVQLALLDQASALTAESMAQLESSYDELRNEFEDSIYARYGAMMMATVYVNQENYDQAATELNWIIDNPELGFMQKAEEELFLTARLRLARVKLAQGLAQEALTIVTEVEPGALAAGFAEVQGDAYLQLGQSEQARSAYERAISLEPDNASFIDLKIRGIGS